VALPGVHRIPITVVAMIGLPVRVLVCVCALGLLAACSSSKPAKIVTVTVPESSPAASSPAATGSPTTSTAASPTTTPTPTHLTKLKGTCETLLPDYDVVDAIGGTPLSGTNAFVVGQPDPTIGRIAYLNCRYGVTGTGTTAVPAIEIGVSLYGTPAKAAARITATVDDYAAHGATTSQVTVEGLPATMLTGGAGEGYDVPLLVIAFGQRTIAVSVAGSVATGDKAVTDATALATLALDRTGH
jgi:hypothetical protein